MATTKLMTADDLMQLPDDGNRYDLIQGVIHSRSPAGLSHGYVALEIAGELRNYVKAHRLGRTFAAETGFILSRDPDTVLAPDVAFIRADRLPASMSQSGFASIAPDLVVEVRSPSDRLREIMTKIDIYLAAGVALVWFVEPDKRETTVFRPNRAPQVLTRDGVLDGGNVLPGFALPLREIFPNG